MGCGGSRSMQVPSGPSDYKYIVQQTWENVGKTLERGSSRKKLVIKRSGWKTVRVFVSSTFKDFHAEREILVKEVFPDLRQWCEKRRLHLVECDLRWGVPKDTSSEETLRLCLGEIDRCYQDNIMPFFLNLTSERCGWIPTPYDVPESLAKEYRWIPGLSVTEMEILHGAYRIDNPNSLFMIRNSSFLKNLPPEYEKDFVDPNPIAPHKLEMLKQMLKSKLRDRVKWYDCEFAGIDEDGKAEFSGLNDVFSKEVFEFFKRRIEAQYPLVDASQDPYQQAKEAHESFLKSRGQSVLGRNAILEKIEQYVIDLGQDKALTITGGAGTGKSSIMARTADVAQTMAVNKKIPGGGEHGWHVFYHFVGAVPGSTDLEKCLKRLLKELNQVNEATMPKNLEAACQLVCSVLSNPKTAPVIVCIDALNQFDDDKSSTLLSWLPRKLAPQVRVILAMINDTPPHKSLMERPNKPQEIVVTPLDMEARKEIVTELLGTYNKRLDAAQMESLLAKESSQNPLWLAVACEELRVFGLFDRLTDKINNMADGLLELLEQVFTRFEQENGGTLLSATLCLLETSATGLLETELLKILGDEDNLLPREKDSETGKDKGAEKKAKDVGPLPAAKWAVVFRALKPFLRPFGESGEGRLDFYHRALSKAVRKKYFSSESDSPVSDQLWWHRKLAHYFDESDHVDRKVEELPIHLLKLGDTQRLTAFLTNWDVFDRLYNEDYSTLLLKYWREGHGQGWQTMMGNNYRENLEKLAADDGTSKEVLAKRYEQISRVINQSGEHGAAITLLETAMELEEELGSRPERMVELYALACTVYDDKLKLYEYVDPSQLRDLRPVISFAHKSIAIRETLEGPVHKYKLGRIKIQLAFNLQSWVECGADNTLSVEEAADEGRQQIESAIEIFKELDDIGHLADAIMTKGVLEERGSEEQKKYYLEAIDLCLQAYGEYSVLASRILLNTGIMYEDMGKYNQAYDYYLRWQDVCEEVFGYHHPRTQRCRNCLNEPMYRRIKQARAAQEANRQARDPSQNQYADDGVDLDDDDLLSDDEDYDEDAE
ncbi:telomerase protein component 1-like [Acanthaster planci]|uniref:Telomerase protein component 1-like n=1 Tax=Acanthaster planci TaxID=133434 RepID=A0A8B7Y841_ACAPL|nr:telomerase protein component 1-like [Acanthaster planci]